MNIEIGAIYANDHIYEDGTAEKNIILVVGNSKYEDCFETETLWILKDKVEDLYSNIWGLKFLQQEATAKEIDLFKLERNKIDGRLKGYTEAVTGVKID